jgi:hypothetical protein
MTVVRVTRAVLVALALAVLVISGVYMIVDLARWEWNRAIISGLFFVASLVIVSTFAVMRAIQRLGVRLDRLTAASQSEVRAVLRSSNDQVAARHFEWLDEPSDGLGVFVPVLLGAGVILSALAYVIERVAGAVAGATLDRRTAAEIVPDLPLLGEPLVEAGRPAPRSTMSTAAVVGWVVVASLTLVLALGALVGIRELTQSRPESIGSEGITTIGIEVDQLRTPRPVTDVAEELWITCRGRLPREPSLLSVTPVGTDGAEMVIGIALGRVGRSRLIGCIEDFTIDLVKADVVAFDPSPTP